MYMDVKYEACRGLLLLTNKDATVIVLLLQANVDKYLANCIALEYEDVHRCAISALANLSKNRESVCNQVFNSPSYPFLLTRCKSPTLQVVRESMRLLCNMGQIRNDFFEFVDC